MIRAYRATAEGLENPDGQFVAVDLPDGDVVTLRLDQVTPLIQAVRGVFEDYARGLPHTVNGGLHD